jgi:arginyl-tRNA synthetase
MTSNLFEYFEGTSAAPATAVSWNARVPRVPNDAFDLILVLSSPGSINDPDAVADLERIGSEPWVDSVVSVGGVARLRLEDSWIEAVASRLGETGDQTAGLADIASGDRFAVQFWDANATKALHVGHLRNLALGNALAASLEQAGGEVERRSIISDAGRSMGEAMAGIIRTGQHAHSWPDVEEKSDHFVGLCYADYVASGGFAEEAIDEREDSLTRELRMQNDAADELLKRVIAGEDEALELWFKTRAWVISGQRKTLARLGVAFDRVFFESDFLQDGNELTERGLRDGTLQRRPDGVVIYETGVQHLEEMPLVRADGQTTQHMRAVSYWMGAPDLEGVTTLQICGAEWVAHATCIRRLMGELTPSAENENSHPPGRGVHPTHDIFHGMVAEQKRAVSSSEGGLLIDDLIDRLDAQIEADPAMREVRRAHPVPERISAQIALGYFLHIQAAADVDFDPDQLLSEQDSLGWDLVRARARRGTAQSHRPTADPAYRYAVVQSELYRRYLRIAVQRRDVWPLAHYLKRLARWYVEVEPSQHVERLVHTLLDRSARGLGLEASR